MKAIRVHQFGGPEVLQYEEVPTPQPGPDQVLIRVHTVGVNPVETYQRTGSNPALHLPWTPGTDAVGVVEALGPTRSEGIQVGDRVYTSDTVTGAYAEWSVSGLRQIHRLPAKLSFAEGAAIHVPYATAYRALHQRARALASETVLIHGASGGVGIAATQIARASGLIVIGTAGTEKGRKLVQSNGAHHVLDHRSANYLDQVMTLTGGRGVDIVLEMLANVNLGKDLTVLATAGRVIVIGSRGNVELTPRELMKREADIRGVMLFGASESEHAAIHAALAAGLENQTLRPVVGQELPLAEAARAHVAVLEPGAYGKIVLRVRPD
jgi:NADPH2:quinone reductase